MQNPFQNHQQQLQQIIDEYGITYLALFGSRARGDHHPDSDYDLLVDFSQKKYPGFYELEQIKKKLHKLLHQKIDLVTKSGMSKYLRPYVKPDLKVLYESN